MKLNETMYAVVRSDGTVLLENPFFFNSCEMAEREIEEMPRRFCYCPNDLRVVAVKLVEVQPAEQEKS